MREEVAEAIGTETEAIPSRKRQEAAGALNLPDELADLARVSPRSAVLESFAHVERELRDLVQASLHAGETAQRLGAMQLAQLARQRGLVNDETFTAIKGIGVLRNLAAHGRDDSDLDAARALDYAALADAVVFAIRSSRGR